MGARRVGATPVEADDRDYATDVDALLAAVTGKTRVVYLANPNNPTGTLATRADVARLYAGLPKDVLFVIDHAYAEYHIGRPALWEKVCQCVRLSVCAEPYNKT